MSTGPLVRWPLFGLFFGALFAGPQLDGGALRLGIASSSADEDGGRDTLISLVEPRPRSAAGSALRQEPMPRRGAEASLGDRARNAKNKESIVVVLGRMGTKAKSGTMPDIPRRLRQALENELRQKDELSMVDDARRGGALAGSYSIDGSVTRLTRRTTVEGELEVSCDVSLVVAALPESNVIGMLQAGASVLGPRGPAAKPTQAFVESLESEALHQAVAEVHFRLSDFLQKRARAAR
jgi:hypothetical protein